MMAAVGSIYLNFAMWATAIIPAWLIIKEIGEALGDKKLARETHAVRDNPGQEQISA